MENKNASTHQLNSITNKLQTEVNQIQQGVTPPSSKSIIQKMAQAGVKPVQENYASSYSNVRYIDTYQMDSTGKRNRVYGDEYDYNKAQQENIERMASSQTAGEKWANGLTKFLGKTSTAVIGGTIGTVNGLKELVTSGNFSSIYDNSFNARLEDLNAKMDYKLPNYYTQAERDKSLFAQMGTANFWANDVLGGLSFTAGAIVSEGLWALATGGTSLATTATRLGAQMSAKGAMKSMLKSAIGKKALLSGTQSLASQGLNLQTATRLGKLGSLANTARFTLTSAGYESSVEAMHYQKEMREGFLEDFEKKNGRLPTQEERLAFEANLTDGANAVFGFNMALVGSSNLAVMGKIYDVKLPSFGISTALNKKLFGVGLDASGKAVLQANRAQKIAGGVYSLTKPMVVEGVWEEGGQSVVGKAFQNYVKASYDPQYTKQSLSLSEAFMEGMEETFTTKEGFKEVLIGMIIGGIIGKGTNLATGRGFSELKGAKELAVKQAAFNTSFSPSQIAENAMMVGRPSIPATTQPSTTGQKALEKFMERMRINSSTTPTTLNHNLIYANQTQGSTEVEEVAGDFVEAQMAKEQGVISQLAMANNLDQYDDTVEDTVLALEAMEVEAIAKHHGITEEQAVEYKAKLIEDYKQTAQEYKQNRDFVEYYLGDEIKNVSDVSSRVLKDAMAYIMTAGKNSYKTSENLLNSIKEDLKNITGVQNSVDVVLALTRLNEDGKAQLTDKSEQLKQKVDMLEAKEAQLAEQQKTLDQEGGAKNLNTLTVEIAELNKEINQLQKEANDILATNQVFKNDTMTGKTSLTREELTNLNESMDNLESVVSNLESTDPAKGKELRDKLEAFKKSTEAFRQFAEVNKAITDSSINLSARKSLIDKITRSSKINEKEQAFLETIASRIEDSKNHESVIQAIKERLEQNRKALEQEDPTITEQEIVAKTAYESLVMNNPYLQGRFTEEELAIALENAELRQRFVELSEQARIGFDENTPIDQLYNSPNLTEEESTELRELVGLLSTLQVAEGFANEGITLKEILEQAIQLRDSQNIVNDEATIDGETFADMATEELNGQVSDNTENISNTALNVQVSERNGSTFIHNLSLKGFLKGLNFTNVESIEEDGTATPIATTAIDENLTPKLRLTLANGDVITVDVTGRRSLKINNRIGKSTIDIIHNNSNYRRIKYTKGRGHAYSFLFENGQMLDSDFTVTDLYNYEAIYDLQEGEELFFEVDMNDPYNQMLRDTNDPNAEQKVKVYITNAKGDVIGELKATDGDGTSNSDNFNLLRMEAFEVFQKGGGVIKYQADVVKVLLGTPKLQVDVDGMPTTVDFGIEQVVDYGYYDKGKLRLKGDTQEVNTDFLHKLKSSSNVPIVVFKRGNQVVALPVQLNTEPSMQGQVFTEFLEQNNDDVAKTIIEINKTLLENKIATTLYFKSPQDQNIFNEDGSFTTVFTETMIKLDNAPAKPDLLAIEKSDLKGTIQSMVDFDNNPIVSPKIIFNLGAMYEGRAESVTNERTEEPSEEEVTQTVGKQTEQILEELEEDNTEVLAKIEKLSEYLVWFTKEGINNINNLTNKLLERFNKVNNTNYTTVTEISKDLRVTEEDIAEIETILDTMDMFSEESEKTEKEILDLEKQLNRSTPSKKSEKQKKETKTKNLPEGKKVIRISRDRYAVVDNSTFNAWKKLKGDVEKSRFLGTYGQPNKDNTKIQKGDYAVVGGNTYEAVGNAFGKPLVKINGKEVVALNTVKGNEKISQQMLENKKKVVTLYSEGKTEQEAINNFNSIPQDSPNLLPSAQRKEWDSSRGDRFLPNSAKDVRGADPELTYLAEEYARRNGIDYKRQTEYVKVDPERAKRIAEAYEQMEHNPQDPVVKEAFQNLIRQTKAQYDILVEAGYKFYFFDETNDPYDGNPARAMRDLTENKTMGVFSTQSGFGSNESLDVSDNPMLEDTGLTWGFGSLNGEQRPVLANDLFRCFTPETLIRTKEGFKQIKDIVVGDYVLTHTGTFKRVYDTIKNPHKGKILNVHTNASFNPIRVTPEHPFYVLKGNHSNIKESLCTPYICDRKQRNGYRTPQEKYHKFDWVEAKDLKEKTWFPLTVDSLVEDINFVEIPKEIFTGTSRLKTSKIELTEDFLSFVGLYIAEGSGGTNRININLHVKEKELIGLVHRVGKSFGYEVKERVIGNGITLQINCKILKEWFSQWLGRGSSNKKIPSELLRLPPQKLKHIAYGIFSGDGKKANNNIEQTSLILGLQLVELGNRLGLQPTTSKVNISSDPNHSDTYTVHEFYKKEHNQVQKKYTWKVLGEDCRQITKIEEEFYEGFVYNIEVEEDHSYVVENVPVHNCVHDAFGHGIEGTGFRARGEENAWQAHARLFTGSAVAAITSETRGQNSWLNYGKHGEHNRTAPVEETIFADQKTGLMPEWTWQEGFDTGEVQVEQVPQVVESETQEVPKVESSVENVLAEEQKTEETTAKQEAPKPKEEKKAVVKPAPEANLTRNAQFMNESNAVHFEKTAIYSLVGRNQPPIITTDAIANGSPIFNTVSPLSIKTIKLLSFNKDTNKGEIQIKTVDNDMHIALVEFKKTRPRETGTTKTAEVVNPRGSSNIKETLKFGITLNDRGDFMEIRVPAYKNDDSDMDLDDFVHGELLKDGDRLHVPNEIRPLMRKKGRIFYGDLAKEAYVRQGNPEFKQGVLIVRNKDSKFSMKQFDSLRIDQDLANNADSNSNVC